MKEKKIEFTYTQYDSIEELPEDMKALLLAAQNATEHAYAPYSNFHVGAAARLLNGAMLTGSNQENASFPLGLCAERVLLASASSLHPKIPITSLAISYKSKSAANNLPISPCGICRQTLQEFETSVNYPIQLILGGMQGPVYVIKNAKQLLPLAFTSEELK